MNEEFEIILKKAYEQSKCSFTFEEVEKIFEYFFCRYKETFGIRHPLVGSISNLVSMIDSLSGEGEMFYPDEYPDMIDKYFETDFGFCDYSIYHFFSGKIRELRWYETCL